MRAENDGQTGDNVGKLPVQINQQWCKKCGICVAFCPRKVLAIGSNEYPELTDAEGCVRCKMCELMCPDFAITVAERVSRQNHDERRDER